MPIYNLIEYSSNYSETGRLWFYSKDEATDIANTNNFKPFKLRLKF